MYKASLRSTQDGIPDSIDFGGLNKVLAQLHFKWCLTAIASWWQLRVFCWIYFPLLCHACMSPPHCSECSVKWVVCTEQEEEGAPFYHCSGLRRISLLINPGIHPDVPVTVFALKLVCELLLQRSCILGAFRNIFQKLLCALLRKPDIGTTGGHPKLWSTGGEYWNNLLSNLICLSNWQTCLGMKGCSARGIFTRLPADSKSFTIHERDLRHPLLPIQT